METCTLKHALELIQGKPFAAEAAATLESMADVLPMRVHGEGLHVDTLLVEDIVLVRGDLKVDGLLEGAPAAHGTLLVVIGNVEAEDVIFYGPMIVTGDMHVRRTAYFESRGDFTLHVGGTLHATVLVEHEHGLTVGGGMQSKHVHRRGGDPRALFVDDVLSQQQQTWRLEPAQMTRAIREGRPVVRPAP